MKFSIGQVIESYLEGSFTPCATWGEAASYLVERGRLGPLALTPQAILCVFVRVQQAKTLITLVVNPRNTRTPLVVRKHASPHRVVPGLARSRGQMALGPICWWRGATSCDGVKAPVDFPPTQSVVYDASHLLASRRAWCKSPLRVVQASSVNSLRPSDAYASVN